MNCTIDYHEKSTTESITGDMHALKENHPPDLPLQGCVRISTNNKHVPVDRQMPNKHMVVHN